MGTDIVTVSAILGHASPTVTMQMYSHQINEARAKAEDALADKLLNI